MNSVTLVGRLDADPTSRLVGNQPVVRIRVAIDNPVETHPTLVDVDVWGKQGAAVAKYLTRGRLVGVVGRLRSSVWRDGVNNRRQHVFVAAQSVEFLDKPSRDNAVTR